MLSFLFQANVTKSSCHFFRNHDFSFDEEAVKTGLKPHKFKVCLIQESHHHRALEEIQSVSNIYLFFARMFFLNIQYDIVYIPFVETLNFLFIPEENIFMTSVNCIITAHLIWYFLAEGSPS